MATAPAKKILNLFDMTRKNFFTSFFLSFTLVIGIAFTAPQLLQVFKGNQNAEAYWEMPSNIASIDGCFEDYINWNSSSSPAKNSKWNLLFITGLIHGSTLNKEEYPRRMLEQLVDLNGDGLPDYFFSSHEQRYLTGHGFIEDYYDCIQLNNGDGWDPAYRCVVKYNMEAPYGKKYYGDCAG
jgi:hypothetical protein